MAPFPARDPPTSPWLSPSSAPSKQRKTERHKKGSNGTKIGQDAQGAKERMDNGFVLCSSEISFVLLECWTIFTSTPRSSTRMQKNNIEEVIEDYHILGGCCLDILLLSMASLARRQYRLGRGDKIQKLESGYLSNVIRRRDLGKILNADDSYEVCSIRMHRADSAYSYIQVLTYTI
jgi:hypothetical protein